MVRKILVPIDDRPITQSAIDHAIDMAQVHRADILFFCVLPPLHPYPALDILPVPTVSASDLHAHSVQEASRLLGAASARAEGSGVHSHRASAVAADAAQAVADAAANRHCDLIVVATEEQNAVVRLLSGSIVPGLISKATVPVLVCRERAHRKRRNTLVRRPLVSPTAAREIGTRNNDEPND